jgi:hypothetical protein
MKIGILTVATNSYKNFWIDLANSVDQHNDSGHEICMNVFTDNPEYCVSNVSNLKKIKFNFFKIPEYGWPDATIKRYELIATNRQEIVGDFLIHMDADMLVRSSDFISEFNLDSDKMGLVEHLGFWRPNGASGLALYAKYPYYLIKDLKMMFSQGGLGAWERRRESSAFVARRFRKKYVCGAIWFGPREKVIGMAESLFTDVEKDAQSGVMAKWHDESHLNSWASRNEYDLFKPNICFDPTYRHLKSLKMIIEAVRK